MNCKDCDGGCSAAGEDRVPIGSAGRGTCQGFKPRPKVQGVKYDMNFEGLKAEVVRLREEAKLLKQQLATQKRVAQEALEDAQYAKKDADRLRGGRVLKRRVVEVRPVAALILRGPAAQDQGDDSEAEGAGLCVARVVPEGRQVMLKSKLGVPESVMAICRLWAESRSKDPSTKVGAAIYDAATGSVHLGYNGFPPGVEEDESLWNNRTGEVDDKLGHMFYLTKYDLVIHAEVNAARKALLAGVNMGSINTALICTHIPCPQCFKDVVLANGINTVLYAEDTYASRSPRDKWLMEQLIHLGRVDVAKLEEVL